MTDTQLIDWVCKLAQNEAKRRHLTAPQQSIFDARMKRMEGIAKRLKRIDYFGGVESLIAKASIVGQQEELFSPVNEQNAV